MNYMNNDMNASSAQNKAFDAIEDMADTLGRTPLISIASGICRIVYGVFKLLTALAPISWDTVFEGKSICEESKERVVKAAYHIFRGVIEFLPLTNFGWNNSFLKDRSKDLTAALNRQDYQ